MKTAPEQNRAAEAATPRQLSESYRYETAALNASHEYLLPAVREFLGQVAGGRKGLRVFDLGCGNGSVSAELARMGHDVVGVDGSVDGIALAKQAYPQLRLEHRSVYDDLAAIYGTFDVVMTLEVIEHLYSPEAFVARAVDLVRPGGHLILSTPYHGYLKNLAIAVAGGFDKHFMATEEHGHIKFWSMRTLAPLLEAKGLSLLSVKRVGRVPALAKSMVFLARKPG